MVPDGILPHAQRKESEVDTSVEFAKQTAILNIRSPKMDTKVDIVKQAEEK